MIGELTAHQRTTSNGEANNRIAELRHKSDWDSAQYVTYSDKLLSTTDPGELVHQLETNTKQTDVNN